MDTPSSRGGGATVVRAPSVRKMDEVIYYQQQLDQKEKLIDDLTKSETLYKETAEKAQQKEAQLQAQIVELEHAMMQFQNGGQRTAETITDLLLPSETDQASELLSGFQKCVSGMPAFPRGQLSVFAAPETFIAFDAGENAKQDGIEEWSFDIQPTEFSDMTFRTELLEQIYDMARKSDRFRMQLVENLIMLLKFKEITLDESTEKQALQTSIDRLTEKKHGMELEFQNLDDLDGRVTKCFNEISEFYDFRDHFKEELEEIKKLNGLNLESPDRAPFSPQVTSSPIRIGQAKSSLRAPKVRFAETTLNADHKSSTPRLFLEENGEADDCRNCKCYLELLLSFRTTQEADRQKCLEQEKTIEKLAKVITSSSSKSVPSSTLRSGRRREGPDACGQQVEQMEIPARKLDFTSPVTGSNMKDINFRRRLGSGDSSRDKAAFFSKSSVPDSTTQFGHIDARGPRSKKDFSSQVHLETTGEKDLRVDVLFKTNQISGLQQEICNLRNHHSLPAGSSSHVQAELAKKLASVSEELNQKTANLTKFELALKEAECDIVRACELVQKRDQEIATLKELIQESSAVNTTQDSSVAGVFSGTTPVADETKLQTDYDTLKTNFHKLYEELDITSKEFEQLLAEKNQLAGKKAQLEEDITRLRKRDANSTDDSSQMVGLKKKIAELEAGITQRIENDRKRSAELRALQNQIGQQAREAQRYADDLKRDAGEISDLRAQVASLQKRISVLEAENSSLSTKLERRDYAEKVELENRNNDIGVLQEEIAVRQNKLELLQNEIEVREEKHQVLLKELRSRKEAGVEFRTQLVAKTREFEGQSRKYAEAEKEIAILKAEKVAKENELQALAKRAQEDFQRENGKKGGFTLLNFFSGHNDKPKKAPARAGKTAIHTQSREPRRSSTFTTSDLGRHETDRALEPVVESQIFNRKLPTSPNSAPARSFTLPKLLANDTSSQISHSKQQLPESSQTTSAARTHPELPNQSSVRLAQNSPSKTLSKASLIPEPYQVAQHPHSLKKFRTNFQSRRCNVCLGHIPRCHTALKCSDCKHVYHERCGEELKAAAVCEQETDLDREEAKRVSLGNSGVSAVDGTVDPTVEGFLHMRKLPEEFKKVYVVLVGETVYVYSEKPKVIADTVALLIIDLNERRRQAEVVCHRTISYKVFGLEKWHINQMTFVFAVEVKFPAGITETVYFRARDIAEKYTWTSAIEDVLTANEVDEEDVAAVHFGKQILLTLSEQLNLEMSSGTFFDEENLLIASHRGLFLLNVRGNGPHPGLQIIAGVEGIPVIQVGLMSTTGHLFMIAKENCELFRADTDPLKKWIHTDMPNLTLTPFYNQRLVNCNLFEILDDRIAVATESEITVFSYENKQRMYRHVKTILIKIPVLVKTLQFSPDKQGLIIGLDIFYKVDLNSRATISLPDRSYELLKYSVDERLGYWVGDERLSEENEMNIHPMNVFTISKAPGSKNRKATEYLLCFYDGGVFVDDKGRKTRSHDISWKRVPLSIQYCEPYLLVMHYNSVQVRKVVQNTEDEFWNYGVSPAFFLQMNEPLFLSKGPVDGSVVLWGKNVKTFKPQICEVIPTISEEQIRERRNLNRDNDTASTSSLTDIA